jgi:hypothetical protein
MDKLLEKHLDIGRETPVISIGSKEGRCKSTSGLPFPKLMTSSP